MFDRSEPLFGAMASMRMPYSRAPTALVDGLYPEREPYYDLARDGYVLGDGRFISKIDLMRCSSEAEYARLIETTKISPALGAITADKISARTITASTIMPTSFTSSIMPTATATATATAAAVKSVEGKTMSSKPEETVREAISRRALDAAIAFAEKINAAESAEVVESLVFGFSRLYEAILPFATPDVKDTLTKFMQAFEMEQKDAESRVVLLDRPVAAPVESAPEDAW